MSTIATRPHEGVIAEREKSPKKRKRRRGGRFLTVYFWLFIVYTLVPIAVMIAYGFNQTPSERVTFAWQGFTLDWYKRIFELADLTNALINSLTLATASAIIATILGTPIALAMARYRYRGRSTTDAIVFTDIAAPSVVVGASLLSFFITLNVARGYGTMLIAHVAFNVAFVVVVVRARIAGLDRSLEEAAQDLGATPWVTFLRVTMPLILPGIISGALLSFALSIDDFIITSFVSGQTLTYPLWVYGAVKVGIPPQVFVMGTVIFLAGVVIAVINVFANRRREALPT
jgi:spermidine/putrescine transport system permease protein